jgi:hypothetical protein
MIKLPADTPPRIRSLPRDQRGFPVPYFVQWIKDGQPALPGEGEPDFRVMDHVKFMRALRFPTCWICGGQMGKHRVFTIGPMCAVNRTISEPPSHRDCAEFACRVCPFLSNPRMRRNEKDKPEATVEAAGVPLDRNPGVMCLWETQVYRPYKTRHGNAGVLISLGDPDRVDWWREGRPAKRSEVDDAIKFGLPALEQMAAQEPGGMEALGVALLRLHPYLPRTE